MSRSLERVYGAAGTNAFTTRLTCPAGHKYEIVATTSGEATGVAGIMYLLTPLAGGGALFLDQYACAAGALATRREHFGAVLYAGDSLQAGAIAAAGSVWVIQITYIDVDYS